MGRLSEYDEEEDAILSGNAELGRKVRKLLASCPPDIHAPLALIRFMVDHHGDLGYPGAAWAWFREQLLNGETMMPDWSPGTVIAAEPDGTIVLDDGVTTWNPARAREFHGSVQGGSLATGGATGLEDIQEAIQRQGEAEEDAYGR